MHVVQATGAKKKETRDEFINGRWGGCRFAFKQQQQKPPHNEKEARKKKKRATCSSQLGRWPIEMLLMNILDSSFSPLFSFFPFFFFFFFFFYFILLDHNVLYQLYQLCTEYGRPKSINGVPIPMTCDQRE